MNLNGILHRVKINSRNFDGGAIKELFFHFPNPEIFCTFAASLISKEKS